MTAADVVIYVAADLPQAHLLKDALAESGIEAEVTGETLQGAAGGLPFGFSTAPRVVVRPTDAQRARRLALQFDQELRRRLSGSSTPRAWHQFSIYGLLVLTACVAVYLAVQRVVPDVIAVLLPSVAIWGFFMVAAWRALRRRKRERSEAEDTDED